MEGAIGQGLRCFLPLESNVSFSSVSLLDFNTVADIYFLVALQIMLIEMCATAKANYRQIALSMPLQLDKCFYRLFTRDSSE